jgi:membrane protease YdiL (CAAX protease family)
MVRARPDDGPSVDPARGVGRVLYLYLLFLATSVVYGMTIDFSLFRKAPPTDEQIRFHLNKMLVVEVIDTVLVLAGIAWAGRPAAPPAIGPRRKLLAWVGAPIILAVLLLVNFAYFRLIRSGLGAPDPNLDRVLKPELIPWLVFGMCLQPAVVEEFFFRYLAQGHLRPVVGTHGAVWIAAVMFGVSHLFNPLGVPYLIVAGAVFGYARVYGRSLAIPMLMHFAHNAIVIWSEPWL